MWLFETCWTRDIELRKYALNPMLFDIPELDSPEPNREVDRNWVSALRLSDEERTRKVEEITSTLRSMGSGRRREFLNVGLLLMKRAGLSYLEVEQVLRQIAGAEKHLWRHVTEITKWLKNKQITPAF